MVVGPTRDSGLESGPESIDHLGIERAHNSINLHSVVGVLGAPQVSWGHHHDRWMLLFWGWVDVPTVARATPPIRAGSKPTHL